MMMTSCTHLDTLARLQQPRLSQSVHREECTQCFDNQDSPQGIELCLTCFNGGCLDEYRHHARTHVQKSGHRWTLNVKRRPKPSSRRAEDEEPPAKMKKLAIVEEREEDKYDHFTTLKCWSCNPQEGLEIPDASNDPKVKSLVEGVMHSLSSSRQSEVKAWEEEITACEHTLMLEQFATGHIPPSGLAHCSQCDLKDNLWLCLTCGSLGCGRQQYGGLGGNGHGLAHFEASQHPVSVKLGTITPEGGADVYCYLCNDSKQDPELAAHLATFGINVQTLKKTEKSMTELQIEQNLKYDFSLTGGDGKALEPVFGPGLTGLANLGNSCYMASVLQSIFSLPSFVARYKGDSHTDEHAESCTVSLPADCVECQMRKIADGLLSGRYSHPAASHTFASPNVFLPNAPIEEDRLQHPSPDPVFQLGVRPHGFKALIGKGHEEFSTMRQQDAEEFFTHLITVLRRDGVKYKERSGVQDPTQQFAYAMEQRIQCSSCGRVRYRTDAMDVVSVDIPAIETGKDADGKTEYAPIKLEDTLESLLTVEEIPGYKCPAGCGDVRSLRQTKFASLPEVLVIRAKKFQVVNWVPAKLNIPVVLPENEELIFSEHHIGKGLQPDEVLLPEDSPAAPSLPEFNQAAMEQLQVMGFPTIRCQKALLATGNSDPEAAMEWLFSHMEDPDIDDPIQLPSSGSAAAAVEVDEGSISMLADMGFTSAQAKKALRETSGNVERAVEWLFSHPEDLGEESAPATSTTPATATTTIPGLTSVPARYKLFAFVSHKGPSVHSGHYVAHIRKGADGGWILFNDEKVVKAQEDSEADDGVKKLKGLAYLYFFVRV